MANTMHQVLQDLHGQLQLQNAALIQLGLRAVRIYRPAMAFNAFRQMESQHASIPARNTQNDRDCGWMTPLFCG